MFYTLKEKKKYDRKPTTTIVAIWKINVLLNEKHRIAHTWLNGQLPSCNKPTVYLLHIV